MQNNSDSYIPGGSTKWYNHVGTVWQFLIQLIIHLLYDSAIPLLEIDLREMKLYVHTKTSTQMFLLTLLNSPKARKSPGAHQQKNG